MGRDLDGSTAIRNQGSVQSRNVVRGHKHPEDTTKSMLILTLRKMSSLLFHLQWPQHLITGASENAAVPAPTPPPPGLLKEKLHCNKIPGIRVQSEFCQALFEGLVKIQGCYPCSNGKLMKNCKQIMGGNWKEDRIDEGSLLWLWEGSWDREGDIGRREMWRNSLNE